MNSYRVWCCLAFASAVLIPSAARAQQRPTTQQAQQMMQNPALLEQLKQRILTSGLTPDQVRARLRAEGYPENLLDAYLPGGTGSADSTANPEDVFSAVTQLGIVDTTDVDLLRCGVNLDSLNVNDTLSLSDSLGGPRGADSAAIKRRNDARKRSARAQCQFRADSIQNGLLQRKVNADSGFTIFGLDFFRSGTSQFDPNLSGPVDPNYRIGPGDRLVLVLTGDVEQAYNLDVTREGFIVIPQVGQIWVNNLTLGELENVLYTRLGRVYSGVRRGPGATTHI
jgi:hypothetical protein